MEEWYGGIGECDEEYICVCVLSLCVDKGIVKMALS